RAEVVLVRAGAVGLDVAAGGSAAAAEQDHAAFHIAHRPPQGRPCRRGALYGPAVKYVHSVFITGVIVWWYGSSRCCFGGVCACGRSSVAERCVVQRR